MNKTAFGLLLGMLVMMGCTIDQSGARPEYLGVKTELLDDDLVRFLVKTKRGNARDVIAYSECAAAQYTLIRGYFFARHVRTKTNLIDGMWEADAAYVISPNLPKGARKLDAETVVAHCAENQIPMV